MFPGGNSNTDLGYNKHNQYMAQPPHFLVAPGGPGTVPGPSHGPVIGNALRSAAPGMPVTMPQGPIDWAQLAQQWIHMRDSATAPAPAPPLANFSLNMPIAPPPPIISNAPEYHHSEIRQHAPKKQTHYEEHGEAEMDMDLEDEENENNCRAVQGLSSDSLPRVPVVAQSPWLDTGIPDVSVAVANNDAVGSSQQQWNSWPARSNPTAHIPSLLKLNVCNPNEPQQIPQAQQLQANNGSTTNEIDANKRKMLPAWIREGLEKMEREKQRQLERQQAPTSPESESPATSGNVKQVSSKSLTTPVNLLNITNVPSDSEDSSNAGPDEEAPYASSVPQLLGNDDDATDDVLGKASGSEEEEDDQKPVNDDDPKLKSQRQPKDTIGRDNVDNVARSANAAEAALSGKNYEERLADLMLVVRRTLTEILLETTNEEIAAIASETLKAHRAKASSAQVIRKSALSSITGNLGLAAYGDSSSESGEEDNSDDDGQVEHSLDSAAKEAREKSDELSAEDLKARIRKSKRAFERVIDDIEERVLLQEKLDEKKLQYHRKLEQERLDAARQPNAKADASTAEDATTAAQSTATDKLQQFSSKRLSRKERTTRFSDNKDGKQPCQSYVSQVVAAAAVQSSIMPQKLKPVPNPATNLLQMPESMASMLSAADKALNKAHSKTTKKSKSRRRQSSSSSSSSSSGSGSSSSSSSDSNSSSNSSKSTSNTDGSSTRSSHAAKKHGSSRSHRPSNRSSSSRARSESSRKAHRKGHHTSSTSSSSRRDSNRHRSSRGSRERDRDRRGSHYSSSQHSRDRRRHRDSSDSGDDSASGDHKRSSRHSSSRSHQSSSYNKHRGRTRSRSRSKSRSTHNSYASSSASTTKHQSNRKRH